MVQLLFIKDKSVIASVCGYPENLGYSISFPCFPESISRTENALFSVGNVSGVITLKKQ